MGDKILNQEFIRCYKNFSNKLSLEWAETDVILIWIFAVSESQNFQSFLPQSGWLWIRNCSVSIGQTLAQILGRGIIGQIVSQWQWPKPLWRCIAMSFVGQCVLWCQYEYLMFGLWCWILGGSLYLECSSW